jgi:hypothetical protein
MIIIGGFGRCGTTLLTESISTQNYTFIQDLNDVTWRTAPGLGKTHGMPPTEWPTEAKVLWCFGNPMNTIVSCKRLGSSFLKAHAFRLGADPEQTANVYYEDVLGLDKHFDAWYNTTGVRLATVKYEALFENRFKIQRFVGLDMKFPIYKKRESDWRSHLMSYELQATYGKLAAKIEAAEDFKVST